MTVVTNDPTSIGTNAWTNPTYAYLDDTSKATAVMVAKNTSKAGVWGTFGFTDPGGTTVITKVEIGTQHYLSTIDSIIATMGREISWDGGTSWGSHTMSEVDTEVTSETERWVECTSDTAWTWTKLNNTNLQVRITCNQGNDASGFTMNLDVIYVRVTYNTVTTYTIDKNSDARFKATLTVDKNSDARFSKAGITIDKNSDARFSKAGITIDKTSDALFAAGSLSYNIDKTSDARFSKAGIYIDKNSDARFSKTGLTVDKTSDARFAKNGQTIDKNSDARFKATLTVDKNSDARFAKTVVIDKTSDAYFGEWTVGGGKTNPEWLKIYS